MCPEVALDDVTMFDDVTVFDDITVLITNLFLSVGVRVQLYIPTIWWFLLSQLYIPTIWWFLLSPLLKSY